MPTPGESNDVAAMEALPEMGAVVSMEVDTRNGQISIANGDISGACSSLSGRVTDGHEVDRMSEQGGAAAVGRQHGPSSLSHTHDPAGTVSSQSQAMEWLSVPDCMDFEPFMFLQGNSEVTIDADVTRYVHTDTLDDALEVLEDKCRVVLCGPPGSGKTTLGRALLRYYRNKEYKPYVFTSIKDWHRHVGQGRKTIVLMDGIFGHTRVKQKRQEYWDHIRTNVVELTARGDCRLVITVYPHVLHELQRLERGTHSPLLDPSVIVHTPQALDLDVKEKMLEVHLKDLQLQPVEQRQLVENILQKDVSGAVFPWCCEYMVHHWHWSDDPTAVFTRPAEAYVLLLTGMFSDNEHGDSFAAVLSLTMKKCTKYLHQPNKARPELLGLGFECFSDDRLARYAHTLQNFVLTNECDRFFSRMLYEAAGLALGRSSRLPILLKVCDITFLSQKVWYGTHKEFFISVENPDDVIHLNKRVYDDILTGQAPLICQCLFLQDRAFLEQFKSYCESNESGLSTLCKAKDSMHGLPLLYWSAWGPSTHFMLWCLENTMESTTAMETLSGTLFSAVLATVLFRKVFDRTASEIKYLLQKLTTKLLVASGNTRLTLPTPQHCLKDDHKTKFDEQKDDLQTHPVNYYLGNHSLPIPATLLSVTITEDAVIVELPSQHWYLALRLLADREVDEKDSDGNTLLHIAVDQKNMEAITLAVKSGASVNTKNKNGQTPCQRAQKHKPRDALALISHLNPFNACKEGNLLAVLRSSKHGQPDKSNGDTPLHVASRSGQTQAAAILTQLVANVNVKNKKTGETPLHCAAEAGYTDVASVLIQQGAAVDLKDRDGSTPHHTAASSGRTEMVRLLLEKRNSVGRKDKYGATALHKACENGHTDTARLLLEHRSKVNMRDCQGRTPLYKALKSGHTETVDFLVKAGARVCDRVE